MINLALSLLGLIIIIAVVRIIVVGNDAYWRIQKDRIQAEA